MTRSFPSPGMVAAVALALPLLAPAATPAGSFVASTFALGLSGGNDDELLSGPGPDALRSQSGLNQTEFDVDALGRPRQRSFDASGQAFASATYVSARAEAASQAAADIAVGTVGGAGQASARASVQVPFLIDAPGLSGSLGVLRVPVHLSGSLAVAQAVPLTPFAPWPGSSIGSGRLLADLSGVVSPAPGNCIAGYDYCRTVSESSSGSAQDGFLPVGVVVMEMSFRFGQWSSYALGVEARADSSVNAVAGPGAPDRALVSQSSSAFTSLRWGGIEQVRTFSGDAVHVWSVQSLPGVDLAVAAVPEPAGWALLAGGLLLLGWRAGSAGARR